MIEANFKTFGFISHTECLTEIQDGIWSSHFGRRQRVVTGERIKRHLSRLVGRTENIQHFDGGKNLEATKFVCGQSARRRMTVNSSRKD